MFRQSAFFLCFVAAAASAASLVSDDVCEGRDDGIVNAGCRSYTQCVNGEAEVIDCSPGVLNIAKNPPGCDSPANTPPPCGDQKWCRFLPDISYPRLDDGCNTFFTCFDGNDMGTQFCSPGTVYNFFKQICEYPENVLPPCGTKWQN